MTPAEAAALRRKVAWRIRRWCFFFTLSPYLESGQRGLRQAAMSGRAQLLRIQLRVGAWAFLYWISGPGNSGRVAGGTLERTQMVRADPDLVGNLFHPDRLCPHARQFYAVRFLLGVAEAGFFPGIIVYFTHWFTGQDRGRALSGLVMASRSAWRWARPSRGCFSNWIGWGWRGGNGFSFWKQRPPSCSGSSPWVIDRSPARRALADPTGTSMAGEPV